MRPIFFFFLLLCSNTLYSQNPISLKMNDEQKFMEAYETLANLAKKNPLMPKLWTDAQMNLLRQAKEVYFAVKDEQANSKVQTVAYTKGMPDPSPEPDEDDPNTIKKKEFVPFTLELFGEFQKNSQKLLGDERPISIASITAYLPKVMNAKTPLGKELKTKFETVISDKNNTVSKLAIAFSDIIKTYDNNTLMAHYNIKENKAAYLEKKDEKELWPTHFIGDIPTDTGFITAAAAAYAKELAETQQRVANEQIDSAFLSETIKKWASSLAGIVANVIPNNELSKVEINLLILTQNLQNQLKVGAFNATFVYPIFANFLPNKHFISPKELSDILVKFASSRLPSNIGASLKEAYKNTSVLQINSFMRESLAASLPTANDFAQFVLIPSVSAKAKDCVEVVRENVSAPDAIEFSINKGDSTVHYKLPFGIANIKFRDCNIPHIYPIPEDSTEGQPEGKDALAKIKLKVTWNKINNDFAVLRLDDGSFYSCFVSVLLEGDDDKGTMTTGDGNEISRSESSGWSAGAGFELNAGRFAVGGGVGKEWGTEDGKATFKYKELSESNGTSSAGYGSAIILFTSVFSEKRDKITYILEFIPDEGVICSHKKIKREVAIKK